MHHNPKGHLLCSHFSESLCKFFRDIWGKKWIHTLCSHLFSFSSHRPSLLCYYSEDYVYCMLINEWGFLALRLHIYLFFQTSTFLKLKKQNINTQVLVDLCKNFIVKYILVWVVQKTNLVCTLWWIVCARNT